MNYQAFLAHSLLKFPALPNPSRLPYAKCSMLFYRFRPWLFLLPQMLIFHHILPYLQTSILLFKNSFLFIDFEREEGVKEERETLIVVSLIYAFIG